MSHQPLVAASVASGALLVGQALELPELRASCEKVQMALGKLKSSELVKKTISTSLCVGNAMNRGTKRDGAKAIVLPDGLLKLDELRGGLGEGISGQTLLDFVSEALVMETALHSGKEVQRELHREALELHDVLHAARGVCLEESSASCGQVLQNAHKAFAQLQTASPPFAALSGTTASGRLALKVLKVEEEAKEVSQQVFLTKEELKQQMIYFSAKPNTSFTDWLSSWVQFLELLSQAILRIKLPAVLTPPPVAAAAPAAPAVPAAPAAPVAPAAQPVPAATVRPSAPLKDLTNEKSVKPQEEKISMQLDDDERIEVLLARMARQTPPAATAPQRAPAATAPAAKIVSQRPAQTRVPVIYTRDP